MPFFSDRSKKALESCDIRLQTLFNEVIKHVDCTILCGHRNQEDQEHAFEMGTSKVHFPNSRHNTFPSKAVDVALCPIDWKDEKSFVYFAGFVQGIAAMLNIKIRSGVDWDGDFQLKDENFFDGPHFELIDE
jgi:peptidoglycan LD-endopeptidase CwlK